MAEFYAELPINIKITGNYHDMGAFASDVAQLPRIVTLNDLAIVTRQGRARHGRRSPRPSATSTRKKSRSSAQRRRAKDKAKRQEMMRALQSLLAARRARRLRRREPSGPAGRGWPTQGKGARAGSTRCRRSSPTSRSPTTRSTCPTRSSRARSSPTKGAGKLAPDLDRRKEPLEAFPLESLTMVGTLEKSKAMYALVRTPDKDALPGAQRQLHGTGLRRDRRHQRHRDQAEGARAGRRRRLDRATSSLPLRQQDNESTGAKTMSAIHDNRGQLGPRSAVLASARCSWPRARAAQAQNSIDQVTVSRARPGQHDPCGSR